MKIKKIVSIHKMNDRNSKKLGYQTVENIDIAINELLKDQPRKRREDYLSSKKFSGVDNQLNEVYQYLDLIGRNKIEASYLLSKENSFDSIQEFVKNQAKALQITSSKAIGIIISFISSF